MKVCRIALPLRTFTPSPPRVARRPTRQRLMHTSPNPQPHSPPAARPAVGCFTDKSRVLRPSKSGAASLRLQRDCAKRACPPGETRPRRGAAATTLRRAGRAQRRLAAARPGIFKRVLGRSNRRHGKAKWVTTARGRGVIRRPARAHGRDTRASGGGARAREAGRGAAHGRGGAALGARGGGRVRWQISVGARRQI